MSAADRLRQARQAYGYASATKAAEILGTSASTYNAHENGQNAFTPEQAERYASAFGVSPAWLFFGETARSAPTVIALVRALERKGILSSAEAREVFEEAAMIADEGR